MRAQGAAYVLRTTTTVTANNIRLSEEYSRNDRAFVVYTGL